MARNQDILDASGKHPQPGRVFEYGTAGVTALSIPKLLEFG